MRLVVFPPKPEEFDMTFITSVPVLSDVTGSNESSFILLLKCMAGQVHPFSIAITLKTASIAPAAPRVCHVYDFVELSGGTESLNNLSTAFPSERSLFIVPVP